MSREVSEKLESVLKRMIDDGVCPGAAISYFSPDTCLEGTKGLIDIENQISASGYSTYPLGCLVKLLTSTILDHLSNSKAIFSLDSPIMSIIPEFNPKQNSGLTQITTRHLLAHTSGINDDLSKINYGRKRSLKEIVDYLSCEEEISRPGERFSYNHSGYLLAARVLEVMTGKEWVETVCDYFDLTLSDVKGVGTKFRSKRYTKSGADFREDEIELDCQSINPVIGHKFYVSNRDMVAIMRTIYRTYEAEINNGVDAGQLLIRNGWLSISQNDVGLVAVNPSFSAIMLFNSQARYMVGLLANSASQKTLWLLLSTFSSGQNYRSSNLSLVRNEFKSKLCENKNDYVGLYEGNGHSIRIFLDDAGNLVTNEVVPAPNSSSDIGSAKTENGTPQGQKSTNIALKMLAADLFWLARIPSHWPYSSTVPLLKFYREMTGEVKYLFVNLRLKRKIPQDCKHV